jgi:biotin carboxyl carrier protein
VVSVNGASILTKIRTSLEEKAFQLLSFSKNNANNKIEVKSPMPGLVLKVKKQKGESIKKGEAVLILEAMKMENEIKSPADGILEEIFVKEGTAIEKNISLFTVK